MRLITFVKARRILNDPRSFFIHVVLVVGFTCYPGPWLPGGEAASLDRDSILPGRRFKHSLLIQGKIS